MPPQTKNVFLDTEVFDRHQHDFSSSNIKRLTRLAAVEEVALITTDVTISEIRSHLDKSAHDSAKQVANLDKANRVVKQLWPASQMQDLKGVTEQSIAEQLHTDFEKFLKLTGTQVLLVDCVLPSTVFNKYFASEPPFNETNKKYEFPDAFAGATLEQWCASKPGTKLYVVSGDPDWRRICEVNQELIYVRQLGRLLEEFADSEISADLREAVHRNAEEMGTRIAKQVEDGHIYFYVDDSIVEGEVTDVGDVEVELLEVYVTEAKEDAATLSAICNLKVTLYVTGYDPESTYQDPDDGELRSVWTASGSVEREFEIDASIEVTFAPSTPKGATIKSVTVPEKVFGISIEESELSRDDDEDDYEFDFPEVDDEV